MKLNEMKMPTIYEVLGIYLLQSPKMQANL